MHSTLLTANSTDIQNESTKTVKTRVRLRRPTTKRIQTRFALWDELLLWTFTLRAMNVTVELKWKTWQEGVTPSKEQNDWSEWKDLAQQMDSSKEDGSGQGTHRKEREMGQNRTYLCAVLIHKVLNPPPPLRWRGGFPYCACKSEVTNNIFEMRSLALLTLTKRSGSIWIFLAWFKTKPKYILWRGHENKRTVCKG